MTQICSAHGCKLIPITNDAGDAVIATDCPKCMATEKLMRDGYKVRSDEWDKPDGEARVLVAYRDGGRTHVAARACTFRWWYAKTGADIIAYRTV